MRILLLPVLLAAVACGDDSSGFAGDYQALTVEENPTGCGNLVAGTIDPSEEYFRLADDDFFGIEIVGYHHCAGPDDCDEDYDLLKTFAEQDGEWVAQAASTTGDPMPCEVSFESTTLERIDDTTITMHEVSRFGSIDEFPDGCPEDEDGFTDFDQLEPYYDDLPCIAERLVTAEVLP